MNTTLLLGLVTYLLSVASVMLLDILFDTMGESPGASRLFWAMVLVVLAWSGLTVAYTVSQDRFWGRFDVVYQKHFNSELGPAVENIEEGLVQREVGYERATGRAGLPKGKGDRLALREFKNMDVEVHVVRKDIRRPGRGIVIQVMSSRDDERLLDDVLADVDKAMRARGTGGEPDLVVHEE